MDRSDHHVTIREIAPACRSVATRSVRNEPPQVSLIGESASTRSPPSASSTASLSCAGKSAQRSAVAAWRRASSLGRRPGNRGGGRGVFARGAPLWSGPPLHLLERDVEAAEHVDELRVERVLSGVDPPAGETLDVVLRHLPSGRDHADERTVHRVELALDRRASVVVEASRGREERGVLSLLHHLGRDPEP